MSDRLTYGLDETGLYITTSWNVFHTVASSRLDGPLIEELRRPEALRVHEREPNQDGSLRLKFNFFELGARFNGGRRVESAAQVFDIIQQFEHVAAVKGWQDPRIYSYYADSDQREYIVNFERPTDSDRVVLSKIQGAMVRYSQLLGWDRAAVSGRNDIRVRFNQRGMSLESSTREATTLSTDEDSYSPVQDRIELGGIRPIDTLRTESSTARLIAFTGLLAVLRAPDEQDTLAS